MKKNSTWRAAALLLALTLITSCFVGGTFAKYVTSGEGTSKARVAKFGVTVGSSGTLFSDQYTTDDTTASGIIYSVTAYNKTSSAAGDNVVAPGTKNEEGITFTLTGKPEVAVKVDVAVTGKDSAVSATDIYLSKTENQATYPDLTKAPYTGTFTLSNDYHPLVFTLTNGTGTQLKKGTLAEIETYLEKLSGSYGPNTDLSKIGESSNSKDGTYKLTWAWQFDDQSASEGNDKADTLLGDLAAGTEYEGVTMPTTGFSTDVELTVTINVTQID